MRERCCAFLAAKSTRSFRHAVVTRRVTSITITPRDFSQSAYFRVMVKSGSDAALEQHNASVQQIASIVRNFYDRKEKFRINHGSTNSTRPRNHKSVVDVGHLKNIIRIDKQKKTVLVEPNVPMDRLTEGTLKHGLIPPVVMEFPGITVGGGYSGTSGESSSFKHGYFDRTINQVEMILADGSIVTASPSEKADLFDGAAGAMGTLGVTTLVELQLLEAKKFVETTYHPVRSVQDALDTLDRVMSDMSNDYVDGILFSQSSGAIITGRMTDTPPSAAKVQTFSGAWDPWFYLHVQDIVNNSISSSAKAQPPVVEVIPLAEYLFRYDRGGFWVGASAFKYFHTPFTKFTRWFLDDFLHTRMMYTALHASGQSKQYVVQDLAVPYHNAKEFIDFTASEFNIWPLWLCPLKTPTYPSMHPKVRVDPISSSSSSTSPPDKLLNIGLWGFGPRSLPDFLTLNVRLSHTLHRLDATRWLYAHTYENPTDFWSTYDKPWYDSLRSKYNATASLPDVYEKCLVDVEKLKREDDSLVWGRRAGPLGKLISGGYGIWKSIQSKSYREARTAEWMWRGPKGVGGRGVGGAGEEG